MPISQTTADHMKRIFTEHFSVGDIAEPLVSFDATTNAAEVLDVMKQHSYEVVGIRQQGVVVGYVERDELGGGPCSDCLHGFDAAPIVSDSDSFPTVVLQLSDAPRLFVTTLGQIGGIVSRSDLQKPPVRMWLFGMVTIIEMRLMHLIEVQFPDGAWRQLLSEGRLEKAELLLEERKRRNQDLNLLDCLQFSDKGLITLKDKTLRERVG
jgi:CBS domain-containing protein